MGHCTYLPESRNIIGPVDSARRKALIRQVPAAEEPAESASNKDQCDRSHRSKERDEFATRTSVTAGWPGKDYDPSLKNSWGIHQRFLKECCRAHRPDASYRERWRRTPAWRRHRSKERHEPLLPGTRGNLDYGRPLFGRLLDAEYRSGERELHCVFYLI